MDLNLAELLARDYYGNSLEIWFTALAITVGVLVVLRVVQSLVANRLQKLAKHTSTKWDDIVVEALRKTKLWFLSIAALFAGANILELPGRADRWIDKTRFDRSHFSGYGDFSLDFESIYYVLERDYNVYMDIHQAINLHIYDRFDDESIDFAFPTRTVILDRADQPQAA